MRDSFNSTFLRNILTVSMKLSNLFKILINNQKPILGKNFFSSIINSFQTYIFQILLPRDDHFVRARSVHYDGSYALFQGRFWADFLFREIPKSQWIYALFKWKSDMNFQIWNLMNSSNNWELLLSNDISGSPTGIALSRALLSLHPTHFLAHPRRVFGECSKIFEN